MREDLIPRFVRIPAREFAMGSDDGADDERPSHQVQVDTLYASVHPITVEQYAVLARHGGASRFAFNQCLRIVTTALTCAKVDPDVEVPWTGFDLINAFNAWKKTEAAGRVFTVDSGGHAEVVVTGLVWRGAVCQQVFEEAAVDLGTGLAAWSDSRSPATDPRGAAAR